MIEALPRLRFNTLQVRHKVQIQGPAPTLWVLGLLELNKVSFDHVLLIGSPSRGPYTRMYAMLTNPESSICLKFSQLVLHFFLPEPAPFSRLSESARACPSHRTLNGRCQGVLFSQTSGAINIGNVLDLNFRSGATARCHFLTRNFSGQRTI